MAVAFVQAPTAVSGSASSQNISFASPLTAGSCVVVCVGYASSAHAITSITDTGGNTYVTADERSLIGTPQGVEQWYALNVSPSGGTDTVTVNYSGTIAQVVSVAEFSGVATSSALSAKDSRENTTTTSHPCAADGSIDTQANVLVVASGRISTSDTITKNANYTAFGGASTTTLRQYRIASGSLTDEQATWTTNLNRSSCNNIVSYLPATITAVTASASDSVTVTDSATAASVLVRVEAVAFDAITITDVASQTVGIRVSAFEYTGSDTLASSNW